jgi:hypothetical protein
MLEIQKYLKSGKTLIDGFSLEIVPFLEETQRAINRNPYRYYNDVDYYWYDGFGIKIAGRRELYK